MEQGFAGRRRGGSEPFAVAASQRTVGNHMGGVDAHRATLLYPSLLRHDLFRETRAVVTLALLSVT